MESNKKKILSWELPEPLSETLEVLIPSKESEMGRPIEVDYRKISAGIFYILRIGIQWQACPREKFGPPSTVYHYFRLWCKLGIFEQMWAAALKVYDDLKGLQWQWQSVDGAMTKAPLGGEATGDNSTYRGKEGTKGSLLTEGKGIAIAVVAHGANRHDMKLLASKLGAIVAEHANYKPRRWVVEVTHSWLNRFRKILVRFEKKVKHHLGLLQLACAYIVFKRAETF